MHMDSVRKLEEKIVTHCSPVLAGLKPASMFSFHLRCPRCYASKSCASMGSLDFVIALESCTKRLADTGVKLRVLAQREKSMLLFLYRPDLLSECLSDVRVSRYLKECGYPVESSLESCITALSARICQTDLLSGMQRACAFPHEVGLFLGYPFDDVMGFIANAGMGYVASGCWKVYSAKRDALDAFCRYEACKEEFSCRFANGACLEDLAASGQRTAQQAA